MTEFGSPSPEDGESPRGEGDLPASGAPIPEPPSDDPERPPVPWRFADLILGLVIGFIVGSLLAGGLWAAIGMENVDGPMGLFIGGTAIYLGMVVFSHHFALKRRGADLRAAGLRPSTVGALFLMIPVLFGVLIVEGRVTEIVIEMFGQTPTVGEQLLGPEGDIGTIDTADLLWLAALAVVVAPLAEEFIFRGLVYGYLRSKFGISAAVIVSSLAFAASHFQPLLIAPLFVLGMALALVYQRYKSLWVPITLHALNNLVVVWISFAVG